jgi:hypothetical protein
MSVTILECLMNAKFNICDNLGRIGLVLGKEQLKNAVTLLEKGYSLHDQVEPLLEKFGDIEFVPEKEN